MVAGSLCPLILRFIAGDLAPGVEELIGGKQAAHLVIHPVADNAQGEYKQLWDIPAIAHRELAVGVVNGGLILADDAFKFIHHQGHTVDVENGIGNPAGLSAFDCLLLSYRSLEGRVSSWRITDSISPSVISVGLIAVGQVLPQVVFDQYLFGLVSDGIAVKVA